MPATGVAESCQARFRHPAHRRETRQRFVSFLTGIQKSNCARGATFIGLEKWGESRGAAGYAISTRKQLSAVRPIGRKGIR